MLIPLTPALQHMVDFYSYYCGKLASALMAVRLGADSKLSVTAKRDLRIGSSLVCIEVL